MPAGAGSRVPRSLFKLAAGKDGTSTVAHGENSDVFPALSVAVIVTKVPGDVADGKLVVCGGRLPAMSVVSMTLPR
jgi:hypothetical protein